MRWFAAVAAALLAALLGPAVDAAPVPHEETRFARVAGELAEDPLFVDMDLADFIDGDQRARIGAAMTRTSRALGVPVYFVAVPNPLESESAGDKRVFLAGVHDHLRRDGLFLMVDDGARMQTAAYGVPRELKYFILPRDTSSVPDYRNPFAGLADRVSRVLDAVAAKPAGPPFTDEVPATEEENAPLEAAFWRPFLTGLLLVGPLAVLVLYGVVRLLLLPRRRLKAPRDPAPARPSGRWVRARAGKELKALAAELDADRPPMVRAYDAARILHDDAGSRGDVDGFLDLVGVIVLARQGRSARNRSKPDPQCFVNPLHGPAGRSRRKIPGEGRLPVCDGCASGDLSGRTLRVPDGRAHYEVPGRWQRSGFGARRPDLAAEALESLGVDS